MAVETAQVIQDVFAEANAWRELGLALKAHDVPASLNAFDHAIALFNELGLSNDIERTRQMTQDAS
jgi:hypothetical protein